MILIWVLQKLPESWKIRLKSQIMLRWIGGVGGMDWYNAGITEGSQTAQMHGKALAATLDAVLDGR